MSNYILGSLKITWRWKRWKRDWVVVGNWQLLRVGVNGSPGGFAHLIPVSWLISCILVGSCSGCSWLPWLRTPWENGPLRGSKLENVGNEWLWCFKMLKNGWSVFVSLTQAMTCWLLTSVDPWSHEAMKPWRLGIQKPPACSIPCCQDSRRGKHLSEAHWDDPEWVATGKDDWYPWISRPKSD